MTHYTSSIKILSLLLCTLGCLTLSGYGRAFDWAPVKLGGNSYVSVGKVKEFYQFDKISFHQKTITLENKRIRMVLNAGSSRCHMNGVLFILSHGVKTIRNQYYISHTDLVSLIDPIVRPTHIGNAKAFNTVIIDPGHGGHDSGAVGHLGKEKDYALKVARIVRDELQKKGYRVVMTRDSDVFVSRPNRVKIANKFKDIGAIFISIHFNHGQHLANGIETFTVSPVGVPHLGRGLKDRDFKVVPGNIVGSASIALATAVHGRSLLYLNNPKGVNFKVADRGLKRARFDVLSKIEIPAVLLEGGFLSNREEGSKIHRRDFQEVLAAAVVRAVDVYRASTKKAR